MKPPLLSLLCLAFLAPFVHADTETKPAKKPAAPKNNVLAPIEDVEGLPRVLILGDSISIGYTLPTRKLLEGVANVHRAQTNCGPTTKGLAELDKWLGDSGKKWDVIHFNWGLHDLKYMGPKGENLADPKDPTSHQQVPPAEYEANLRTLVTKLKATGAELIWCSTTPVPEGAGGRVVGDSAKYNEIAAKVMKENEVDTNDLYSFVKPQMEDLMRPANVHFTTEGSQALAEQVAAKIKEHL